jgi:hypothetical protein
MVSMRLLGLHQDENSRIVTVPAGLNKGEKDFVKDLRDYLNANSLDSEIYLLRNLTRSRGVGFYESHSFYPDFILWLKKKDKQTIVFIDPKGLTHLGLDDPKLNLHEYLRDDIEKELGNPNVKLDAFVISVTPFRDLARLYGEHLTMAYLEQDRHVLFQSTDGSVANTSCIKRMFEIISFSR